VALQDETDKDTDAGRGCLEEFSAFVPAIWPLEVCNEVCNVLLVVERRNRISQADSFPFISLLTEFPIYVEQKSPERMFGELFALARECKISSYDATYLDLAMRKGLSLATMDKKMILAARTCSVSIVK
jgi:predicted nucleic acid-binding protein